MRIPEPKFAISLHALKRIERKEESNNSEIFFKRMYGVIVKKVGYFGSFERNLEWPD
jgi:hypothetical protein